MFEISKERVDIPTKGGPLYPFADMKVGEHFDAPRDMGTGKNGSDRRQNSIGTSARGYKKRSGSSAKFTIRVIDENTVRCWRIK